MTADDGPGTRSTICHNEVDIPTPLQSGHNTERNARNGIVIRIHPGSNDHRGTRQETTISSRHLML